MLKENKLGFHPIKLYSLKHVHRMFALIFSANHKEAVEYYQRIFHQSPLNCHEILQDYEMLRGNEVLTFRDMKKEHEKFPALVGVYEWEGYEE